MSWFANFKEVIGRYFQFSGVTLEYALFFNLQSKIVNFTTALSRVYFSLMTYQNPIFMQN